MCSARCVTREQNDAIHELCSIADRHHPTERDCSSCKKGREVTPVVRPCTFAYMQSVEF